MNLQNENMLCKQEKIACRKRTVLLGPPISHTSRANWRSMEVFLISKATGRPWGQVRMTDAPSFSGFTRSLSQSQRMCAAS